jgi:hypothetical protein
MQSSRYSARPSKRLKWHSSGVGTEKSPEPCFPRRRLQIYLGGAEYLLESNYGTLIIAHS